MPGDEAHPCAGVRHTGPVAGEEELFELFDDLEAQAEAMHHLERSAEVADRSRVEYQAVTLDSRLMASTGRRLEIEVRGIGRIAGVLERVGPAWCELEVPRASWVVRTAEVTLVQGASDRSVPEVAWTAVQRLGLGSPLRRLADESAVCSVHVVDGTRHEGRVLRVGADFLELSDPAGRVLLLALHQLAGVRAEG